MDANCIKKGQYVVYGTNGVCHIDDICEMAFPTGREKKPYLLLRPLADTASVIYLPYDNTDLLNKLRPILTKEEATKLLATANNCCSEWIEDRKARALSFRDTIQQSQPESLLSLIRCVCHKRDELASQNKKLPNADREAMDTALKAVCEEFAFSLTLSNEDVLGQIEAALSICIKPAL